MGYSEVLCHICGVSFNIGRLRTKHEPRSHSWQASRYLNDFSNFPEAGSAKCPRGSECMLEFREDGLRDMRRWSLLRKGDVPIESESQMEQKEEMDDELDEDFVLDVEGIEDDEHASPDSDEGFDVMDYEYNTPPDICCEFSDEDVEEILNCEEDSVSEAEYRQFVEGLQQPERARVVEDNVILPMYRPLEGREEDNASIHGSEASFECDAPGRTGEWDEAHLHHHRSGKMSHYKHPLSKGLSRYRADTVWEHIAGPGCQSEKGYHGDKISIEEMEGCNILQCLVEKQHAGDDGGEPDSNDEEFERNGNWFLSGIGDHMPSRDMGSPSVFPQRHGVSLPNAENHRFGPDSNNNHGPRYAMPFHPTCLEVYKRASLKRLGRIDIESLGSWWQLDAGMDFRLGLTRSESVSRAQQQEWEHSPGDEYLAANPCFVPGLKDAITAAHRIRSKEAIGPYLASRLGQLPPEILNHVWTYLETNEIAKCALAFPELNASTDKVIRFQLEDRYPSLWELWSEIPYSKWTGTTATELKARDDAFNRQQHEIGLVLKQLQEEGWQDLYHDCKQYWNDNLAERRASFLQPSMAEKQPLIVKENSTNIATFALAFENALNEGMLKGFENRARIWTDCQAILSLIAQYKDEGKIRADGRVAPGAKVYLYGS